ncbi:ypt/Rab-type GTPase ypt7-like [Haliotis rubra]|uniref:ypt/Rab-type GTPase ypt7-like n=1 Tax=Haliotis rubra TaxID=36100 RepID=UPI001EE557F3|nr:ypt/Rab-type GTPase ypt7-like [Haliotis rubra]
MDASHTLMLSNQVTVMSQTDEVKPGKLKLVLLGNQHVGKTSLLQRYVNNVYNTTYTHTRGGDIFEKELLVDGRRIQLNFVDTAGQADVKLSHSEYIQKRKRHYGCVRHYEPEELRHGW